MYIVPQRTPADSAATTPRNASPGGACAEDATASAVAPPNINSAPPSTPSHRLQPAPRSSLKSSTPQRIPSRLLLFQSGNAMLSPTSRMAKIVSVFATAHRHPASTAQTMRCGACRRSAPTYDVPWMSAGRLQRARKTPTTIASDTTTGERPIVTSLVGASAAPSHAPAASPQKIPTAWRLRSRAASVTRSRDPAQDEQPADQHRDRHPELHVAEDEARPAAGTLLGGRGRHGGQYSHGRAHGAIASHPME